MPNDNFVIAEVENEVEANAHFGDSANIDAFGRLRIGSPFSLFDSKQLNEIGNNIFFTTKTTGSGSLTYLSNESATELSVTTTSGDKVVRQTKEYFNYQPAKSLLIFITGVMGSIKSNVRQRIGYFDDNNGVFFEQDGTNLKVVTRSKTTGSVVDTAITQANWNIDKLDGTGDSGITIDNSKTQIFIIDLEWLGVGRVRLGVVIDGKVYYCHQFLNANNQTTVYMTTPNLPVRYEIENTGTAASSTDLLSICCSVISEGGYNPRGVIRTANSYRTEKSIAITRTPVISIRLKSSHIRSQIIPLFYNLIITSNSIVIFELIHNGSLSGTPSWVSVGSNSVAEYDVSATGISGGEIIGSDYAGSQGNTVQTTTREVDIASLLKGLADIDGTADIISLVATGVDGTANGLGGITWKEIF